MSDKELKVAPSNQQIAKMDKQELLSVLQASLYPGAKQESIELVLSYCKATGLDVMQKPVHIVPMSKKNPQTNKWEYHDTIMPGIGLYRIQADRSGSLAGVTEPEFGPMFTTVFTDNYNKNHEVSYPEWCKITIKKIVSGIICEFTAMEFWVENYATAGGTNCPNTMWRKRPKGQLAKCSEAQALRKAFPEVGAAPTAEEMEGKTFEVSYKKPESDNADDKSSVYQPDKPKQKLVEEAEIIDALPMYPHERFIKKLEQLKVAIPAGKITAEDFFNMVESKNTLTEDQKDMVRGIK